MNSLEYWRKREDEARQKNIKTDEKLAKELKDRIEYMLNQMNKEIANFYAKYANDEDISISEAKKRVTKLDIEEYARKAKKYVREKDFSDEANEEMKLYNLTMKINRLELLKANLGLEIVDCFNDLQKYYEDGLNQASLDEFQRMSGILGKTVLNNGQQARELVNTSFYNATFSQRIWGHSAIFRDEVSKLLTQGLTAGINSMELARRLRKTVDVTKHQAETLMHTEMSRVRSGAQIISIGENGYDDYVFVSDPIEGKGHACHVCKSLDGKIFKLKDGQPGKNLPPMHPWCKCSIAASFSEDDDALYDEWLDGYKKHGLTFDEWLRQRKEESKRSSFNDEDSRLLGSLFGRARFKTGGIDARYLADQERLEKDLENKIKKYRQHKALDTSKAVDVLREESKEWIKLLTDEEKSLIKRYTYNQDDGKTPKFYEKLNKMLRGEMPITEKYERYADVISNGIKKYKLKNDLVVYRNIDNDDYKDYKINDFFTTDQFVSTSATKSGAFDKKYKIEIHVPKGSRAAYIELVSHRKFKKQREVLIDKDTTFRVLSKKENKVILEVI